jgi:formylglycine-generating enzyme required for sulfatase activity/energy-coupling factor transporter ATP-binding protein EcfA2
MSSTDDLETLKHEINAGNLVTIVGTGVSIAACGGLNAPKAASWTGLMKLGLDECVHRGVFDDAIADVLLANIETGDTRLLIGVAEIIHQGLLELQGLCEKKGSVFRDWLSNSIGKLQPTDEKLLNTIRALPGVLATLNYDSLLEGNERKPVTWKEFYDNQQALLRDARGVVLHLHGHYENLESVVLGLSSYIAVRDYKPAKAIRRSFLTSRTVLFIGCGDTFLDPNFSEWLRWANDVESDGKQRHALLCRAEERDKFLKTVNAPWLNIISYGEKYDDLQPFLQSLLPPGTTIAPVNVAANNIENLSIKTITYIEWLCKRTSHIFLHGIAGRGAVPLPLDEVYVPLSARPKTRVAKSKRPQSEATEGEVKPIEFSAVLKLGNHLAITGGAGSGKSTVLQYMAWVLSASFAAGDNQLALQKLGLNEALPDLPLPIFVPLATLARIRRDPKDKTLDVSDFKTLISAYMREEGADVPSDFFARLLKPAQSDTPRKLILLLDGLDEVPSAAERRIFRKMVRDLVAANSSLRVVLTCRTVAYEGSDSSEPLGADFRQVTVDTLDLQAHVKPLVENAYACIHADNRADAKHDADHLLKGITKLEADRKARLRDAYKPLVDSPLMVRMMLIVHLGEHGKLPDDRAELFEKTIQALLNANYSGDLAHKQAQAQSAPQRLKMLQHLAFHMHQQAVLAGKNGEARDVSIERPKLEAILSQVIDFKEHISIFREAAEAETTVLQFKDPKFSFIHLALQEFLVARYVYEVLGVSGQQHDAMLKAITPRLEDDWWREPILLLAGYMAWQAPGAARDFLQALAEAGDTADTRFCAAELAATAALEVRASDSSDVQQYCAAQIVRLLNDDTALANSKPTFRARAGNALSRLGDPRFDPNSYYLPAKDPLFGFALIPEDKNFIIGTRKKNQASVAMMAGVKPSEITDEINDQPTPTREFYIARYPVTVAQFRASGLKPRNQDAFNGADNSPVCYVSWNEAMGYCEWLQRQFTVVPALKNSAIGQRLQTRGWCITLPSELEWEKAARGRLIDEVFPWRGKADTNRANYYHDKGIKGISAVGCFPPNCYGLYDMAGNVWEWTRSPYAKYPPQAEDKPVDRADDKTRRVLRGGAWGDDADSARCAVRDWDDPDCRSGDLGFRVVLRSPLL